MTRRGGYGHMVIIHLPLFVRKRYDHREQGTDFSSALAGPRRSRRTELIPRRNRASLGVAGKRDSSVTGPPRLSFPLPIVWEFLPKKSLRFEVPLGSGTYL